MKILALTKICIVKCFYERRLDKGGACGKVFAAKSKKRDTEFWSGFRYSSFIKFSFIGLVSGDFQFKKAPVDLKLMCYKNCKDFEYSTSKM